MTIARAPLLPLAAALALGIAVAPSLRTSPLGLVGSGAALLVSAAAWHAAGKDRLATIVLLGAFAVIGALRAASPVPPADHIARRTLPSPVTVEARLVSDPVRWAPDRARLLLDVDSYLDGPDPRPARGRVQLTVHGETVPLGEGQRIAISAQLHPPVGFRNPGAFDYPAHLRREGILLVGSARGDRIVPLTADDPPWPVKIKRWALAAIRAQLPDASAALLAGLLLGERAALPREADEAFRRAGVYHVLAVSGFNVALLAGSIFATVALVGVPRRAAALCAGAALVGFALVVGAQPSVLRATVMGLLLLASVVLERESEAMNALALAGVALLLWSPGELRAPGFQLSFAATAGIVHLAPPLIERLGHRGWPMWSAGAVAVSLAAQLAITPIMLAFFNQLSLIGVLANLLVVPLAGPATVLGMLALALSLASDLAAALVFNTLWLLLVALRAVVWIAAAIPNAMVHLPAPGWAAIAAWYAGLVIAPLAPLHRAARASLAGLGLAVAALSLWPWLAPGDGKLRVVFLDVGQGDATLIELPDRRRILVDGGPGGPRRLDVGEHVLSPFLWNRPARRLDVIALSHADHDHAGGLAAVLRHFAVGELWENGSWSAVAPDARLALERSGAPRRALAAGDRLQVGEARITVLNPDGAPGSTNDASLVLRLDWRGVSLLLPGDLGREGEERLLSANHPLRVVALKVAHHGSRLSSSASFLEAARPAIAVVSAGARNPFRHPAPDTLRRLEAAGARIYRTDRDGAIILETDGTRLWMTRWALDITDVFELDPAPPGDGAEPPGNTTAPGDHPEAVMGRAESGRSYAPSVRS